MGGLAGNVLLYADDLVLIAPSWHAQQKMLDLCATVVTNLQMKFNRAKSHTLIFLPYNGARRVSYSFPFLRLIHVH